jgi:hypothetical protein
MRRRALGVLALLLALSAGAVLLAWRSGTRPADPPREAVAQVVPPTPAGPGYFEDVTPGSGLGFTYHNGEEAGLDTIFESLGGGVALLDYDGDGLLDVFLTGGGYFDGPDQKEIKGHPCKLYKNLGGFRFRDVTAEVGLDRLAGGAPWFYTHGCAVADYDNDGWPDLLVTGWGRIALFHNEVVDPRDPGRGRRFVDVSAAAGLDRGVTWATSAAFGDLDGDGFPDLYVCQYVNWSWDNNPQCKDLGGQGRRDVCSPEVFEALPHLLYHNDGGRTFTDVSAAAGLRGPRPDAAYALLTHLTAEARERLRRADRAKDYGKGLGVLIADLDDDGRPDIYVANDSSGNLLYLNRGGGRLEEVGRECGAACDEGGNPTGSMGVDATDYDGSGRLSLFVTNFQNQVHGLYRNRGKGQFVFASRSAGLAALGRHYVGFGTGFLDFDLDGNEDLVLSNGHVVHYPPPPGEVKQRPLLLRNARRPGDQPHEVRFVDVSAGAGPYFQEPRMGRGVALGDLDNDGRTDIVLNPMNEPAVLLRNRHETGHHWLGVGLVGRPYRDAVGARLELEVGGQTLVRAVKGGGSYLSSGDRRVIFGLGANEQVGRLRVRWPSGKEQTWQGLTADRYWTLTEGEEQARPVGGR